MSQRERNPGVETASDKLAAILDVICRFVFTVGVAAALIGLAFLIFNYASSNQAFGEVAKQATANINTFGTLMMAGLVLAGLAVSYLQWGEEVLGPLLLIAWAALFFSPLYLPSMFGNGSSTDVGQFALTTIQRSSIPAGIIGLIVVIADVATRTRLRIREGTKADQLKFGKGLKEEKDIRNVFLGKCWQLPYCRKFVRERCPIYHARRTCWKERVGCMCEESVIRNAMEGRVIPSDAVAAAKYIPQNHKLTADQKAERCRQCVIFNEHQKHKYKLAMPVAIGGMGAVYVLFHEPLNLAVKGGISGIDSMVGKATLRKDEKGTDLTRSGLGGDNTINFSEIILIALLIVGLAYVIRFIEYLVFKAKV
ncbi:MAG: hypothetical protein JSS66_13735 [Armatimonadetes bacterium]|nr:hypothetical protein [Armatimonadota bacterium]